MLKYKSYYKNKKYVLENFLNHHNFECFPYIDLVIDDLYSTIFSGTFGFESSILIVL